MTMSFALSHPASAQSSLDLRGNVGGSGIPGGSIMPGFDTSACGGSNEGAIRYNSAASCAEFCDGTDWVCPGVVTVTAATPPTSCPDIGDPCDDGSIYAGISPDGEVKMYTTPADAGSFVWGPSGIDTMANCNSNGLQNRCVIGETNTNRLVGLAGSYPAASHCDNLSVHGHSDWYLPAWNELKVMYANRIAIGGFDITPAPYPFGVYWSSSERSDTSTNTITFDDGFEGFNTKNQNLSVRCVRR